MAATSSDPSGSPGRRRRQPRPHPCAAAPAFAHVQEPPQREPSLSFNGLSSEGDDPLQLEVSMLGAGLSSSKSVAVHDVPSSSPSPGRKRRGQSLTLHVPAFDDNPNVWMPTLLDSVLHPTITMTLFQAMCIRLQRVYLGLLMGVYVGYLVKVSEISAWSAQLWSIVGFGILLGLVLLWLFFVFPLVRLRPRFRSWFWTDERFHSQDEDADV